jgi:phosphotransferase system enzyme I (PtsI)
MTLLYTAAEEVCLHGSALSPGIAIGRLVFLTAPDESVTECNIVPLAIDDEIGRYRRAVDKAKDEVRWLQLKLESEGITAGVEILEAHLQMMRDSSLTTQVEDEIRRQQKNAEYVFLGMIRRIKEKFSKMSDPFFRERFREVQDISQRILGCLRGDARSSIGNIPPDSVIFAEELSASHVAEASLLHARAFVTQYGGSTSHVAIVSKAKGIPLVTNIDFSNIVLHPGTLAIVDGNEGQVFLNPSDQALESYGSHYDHLGLHRHSSCCDVSMGFETYDGHVVKLSANVEMLKELDFLHDHGGSGVGLFRSEYAFLSHSSFPTEEEQFNLYRGIVESMRGLPIAIRTFDLGGDKYMACQQVPHENNPFLGCRAIRFLLREKEIFKNQLKAVLRCCRYGNVSIMFPLVTSVCELREAKELLFEAQRELEEREQLPFGPIRIGCMIEVPSAALVADMLAKECDFLSIGTNDLVQYTLAVDRGNHLMSGMYTPAHPSIIRLIKHVVIEANHQGIPVAICGEVAGDVRFTALLLGLGIEEFSVVPRHFAAVKEAIRNTSIVEACKLADMALSQTTSSQILELLGA